MRDIAFDEDANFAFNEKIFGERGLHNLLSLNK